jgi:fibronectin-binding autotransporter adhesin
VRRKVLLLVILVLAVGAGSAVAAAVGSLTPAGCIGAPVSCTARANLIGVNSVTVTPDGRSVYATSFRSAALETFTRAADGGLTPSGCIGDSASGPTNCIGTDGLRDPSSLAVSPDGQNVYVAAAISSDVVLFGRSPSGALSPIGCIGDTNSGPASCTAHANLNGADGVAVSPDGHTVYVVSFTSKAIEVMARASNGSLTPSGCVGNTGTGPPNCNGADGLDGARAVVVSPDGKNVYVASEVSNALVMFARNTATGAIAPMGCIGDVTSGPASCSTHANLNSVQGIAISPDGRNVYAASTDSKAVEVFTRAADGSLTPSGCVGNSGTGPANCTGADGLDGADSVAVSPDGQSVYVTGATSDAVVVFARNTTTGAITPAGCIGNTATGPASCNTADGLAFADAVTVSPDGLNVYVTAATSDALVTFNRTPAGGSGGTGSTGGSGSTGASTTTGAAPQFTQALHAVHSVFHVSGTTPHSHKARRTPAGATFTFSLSEDATVTITILQAKPGRRAHGGCAAPNGSNASDRHCTRYVAIGSLNTTGHAGPNKLGWGGRLSGTKLPADTYRASAIAADSSGQTSAPSTIAFAIDS